MMDYIATHSGETWLALGFALLAIEVLVMAMASGIFMFAGLGCLLTGILILVGLLPPTLTAGIASMGVSSLLIAVLLWQPLKRMQSQRGSRKNVTNDLIGMEFVVETTITMTEPGVKRYSGINWRVEIEPLSEVKQIDQGSRVSVTAVEVGLFKVSPV